MEERQNPQRRPRSVRKPKSKLQLFKENQLPLIIAAAAAVMILIFVIGSISNGVKRNQIRKAEEKAAAEQAKLDKEALDNQVQQLLQQADIAAVQYDYDKAIGLLDPVKEHTEDYPVLQEKLTEYENAKSVLVAWDDPSKVPNLSFQMLIASPVNAFNHEEYGSSFNRNYVTTGEFSAILNQLYANGYVLVTPNDLFTAETAEDGSITCAAKTLYLPADKKPIVITQTNVNYNYYLIDSNDDKQPDPTACGFAHKLLIQDGKPVSEIVSETGAFVQGDYDLIPILETFITEHPDFSYHGSKAVVAVTGYDGLFGYRTAPKDQERLGDAYQTEIDQAISTAQTLQDLGYQLACYTYRNIGYGDSDLASIKSDLELWNTEVAPLIGTIDTLVYAQRSDIADSSTVYSGERYDLLRNQGFRYYLGFSNDGSPWTEISNDYVRQGRIMVAGATLKHHSDWFSGIFDPATVLDASRGEIAEW